MSDLTMDEFDKRFAEFRKQPKRTPPPKPLDPVIPFFLRMLQMLRFEGQYEADARELATALTATGVDWGDPKKTESWNRLRRIGTNVLCLNEIRPFPTLWSLPKELPKIVDGVLVFPPPKPLPPPDIDDSIEPSVDA